MPRNDLKAKDTEPESNNRNSSRMRHISLNYVDVSLPLYAFQSIPCLFLLHFLHTIQLYPTLLRAAYIALQLASYIPFQKRIKKRRKT